MKVRRLYRKLGCTFYLMYYLASEKSVGILLMWGAVKRLLLEDVMAKISPERWRVGHINSRLKGIIGRSSNINKCIKKENSIVWVLNYKQFGIVYCCIPYCKCSVISLELMIVRWIFYIYLKSVTVVYIEHLRLVLWGHWEWFQEIHLLKKIFFKLMHQKTQLNSKGKKRYIGEKQVCLSFLSPILLAPSSTLLLASYSSRYTLCVLKYIFIYVFILWGYIYTHAHMYNFYYKWRHVRYTILLLAFYFTVHLEIFPHKLELHFLKI